MTATPVAGPTTPRTAGALAVVAPVAARTEGGASAAGVRSLPPTEAGGFLGGTS